MERQRARIYRPDRPATQSGRANTRHWVLEFEPARQRHHDPVTGWVGSDDTMNSQVTLTFPDREQAVAFAESQGWPYEVLPARERRQKIKSYGDNFPWDTPE